MIRTLAVFLLATSAFAQVDRTYILQRVEERYNKAKTLTVGFEEAYSAGGRGRKPEKGNLTLRKPGRMRWDYTDPAGKVFVSDGKNLILYTPADNKAERMRLKETDDLRAPLAFLLGKLDFNRDFEAFTMKQSGGDWEFTAKPKSDKLPYQKVFFVISPEFAIKRLHIVGQDNSVLAFIFTNEAVNAPVDDKIFKFALPAGASLVDASDVKEPGK